MSRRLGLVCGFLSLLLMVGTVMAAPSIDGDWTTVDDVTGHPKSIVHIFQSNGKLYAKVVKLLPQKGIPLVETCSKCKGSLKDKPIVGMQIMWGLKPEKDGSWDGGTILDPKIGKTYSCSVTPTSDGKHLKVRGYVGFSLLGRTQTWVRAGN